MDRRTIARFEKSKDMLELISAEQIERIENPLLKRILTYRVVEKLTVSEISEKIHYSLRHTFRLIKAAAAAACGDRKERKKG